MICGNCGGEGHNTTTCTTVVRGARSAQEEDALTTATYDGRDLELNGKVLGQQDKRRGLVSHILLVPGVTAIHEWAYCGFTSLSSVNLPEGLTTIGEWAFCGCTSLTSVTLPEGLTTLGIAAFFGCTTLSSISLPEGLVTIGDDAFYGCTILEQRSRAAGHPSVEAYLRFVHRANRRYAVLASLARLRDELYARQAKRARHQQAEDDAVDVDEDEVEEQAGVLRGVLAFDIIHSDDLWRHILEFV